MNAEEAADYLNEKFPGCATATPRGRRDRIFPLHFELEPLLFSRARIILTDGRFGVESWWDFESQDAAVIAFVLFVFSGTIGEPAGWVRASTCERREIRRRDAFLLDDLVELWHSTQPEPGTFDASALVSRRLAIMGLGITDPKSERVDE